MKAVILAGGMGTRISEESHRCPKPMIEIGSHPILWHIMKIYSSHNVRDFIICCGHKGYIIKEYFSNYALHNSDITYDMRSGTVEVHQKQVEPWRITIVDTGQNTMTGGRLKKVSDYLGDEDFCFTYGDGVGDVNISELIEFHQGHGKLATVTATQNPGRWGVMQLDKTRVTSFLEKPENSGFINGGFFVLNPKVIDFIAGDTTIWEREPMEHLARENAMEAYIHRGFWHPMDTLRDKNYLEDIWTQGKAPWKTWQ